MKKHLKILPFLLLSACVAMMVGSSPSAKATELIVNGDFELGSSSWTLSGGVTASTYASLSHSGSYYLWFGGAFNENDAGYQTITIPANATAATLSFYYNINSDEGTSIAYDTFSATVRNTSGTVLATVLSRSNINKDGGAGNPYYHQQTFNLLPYVGQTIRIYFSSVNDSSKVTNFRVDDVSVQVTTSQTKIISLGGNLAFGNVTVNSSAQSTLTIYNNGNSTLTVNSISYPSGFSGSWSGTIAAGSSHSVIVTFSPTSATSYGGTVTVNSDATSGVNTITASGTGTVTPTRIISLGGNLAFGSVAVGSTPQSTLTIYNTGSSTMTVSSISYPSGFSGSWSGTIAAGGSHPVTVTFSPTSAISYGGTVTVNSDATSGVNTISASGTGTASGTQPLGIDVHGAQGAIGWAAVHTAGKSFAFLKATEGTTFIDTDFTAATHNIDNALANNLLVGAYHYALPLDNPGTQGAIAEAQHFLDIAGPYIGNGFLPPVLDIEDHPYPEEFPGDPCLIYYNGDPVAVDLVCKLGKSQLSAWVRAWVQKVYDTTGVRPIVYMTRYYARQGMENDLNVNPLWIATNEKNPQGDPGALGSWTTWTFQQYDWNGRVPGVGNGVVDVDLDSFNGDLAGLQALANQTPTSTRIISLSGDMTFGSVPVGSTAQRTLTIHNTGNSTLNVNGLSYPSCLSGNWSGAIAASSSHDVTITFSPSAQTSFGGNITVNSDMTSGTSTITFSGAGTIAPPNMSLAYNGTAIPNGDTSPTTAKGTDFGTVNYGSESLHRTFTINNTGTGALNLTGTTRIQIGGNNPSDFLYYAPQPSSPVGANGGSTTFILAFEPTVNSGLRSATVTIPNDDPNKNPYTFMVQGTADFQHRVDPSLEYNGVESLDDDLSPSVSAGTDFGSVDVGAQSATHSFRFYNYGTVNMTLTGSMVQLSGVSSGDFAIVSIPSSPIAPNQYSTIGIRFQPTGSGLRTASMLIYYDDTYGLGATSPYTVALQGTGLADTTPPALTIASPLNNATVTSASLPVSGTASDSGYGNNGISSVTVNGASASGGTASGTGTAYWNATISLNSGANTVTVVAKDTLNNSTQKVVSVTYNPPQPIFGGSSVTGGQLQTTLSGLSTGEKVVLYSSIDLKTWTPIQTNTVSGPTLPITSAINPTIKNQYFRIMVQ